MDEGSKKVVWLEQFAEEWHFVNRAGALDVFAAISVRFLEPEPSAQGRRCGSRALGLGSVVYGCGNGGLWRENE